MRTYYLFKPRKFFWAFFLFILIVILQFSVYIIPVRAISTISKCSSNPACARQLIQSSGVKSKLVQGGKTATNNIVKFNKFSDTGNVINSQTINFQSFVKPVVGALGLSIIYEYLTDDSVDILRAKVTELYCQEFSSPVCGTQGAVIKTTITAGDLAGQERYYFSDSLNEADNCCKFFYGTYSPINSKSSKNPYKILIDGQIGGSGATAYSSSTPPEITIEKVNEKNWEDWTQSDRDDAIDLLDDTDIYNEFVQGDLSEFGDVDFNNGQGVLVDVVDSDGLVWSDGDLSVEQSGDFFISKSNGEFVVTGLSSTSESASDSATISDSATTSGSATTSSSETSSESEQQNNSDLVETKDSDLDEQKKKIALPDIDIGFEVICEECEEDNFSKITFYDHVYAQMITKFPFDIFGDINSLSSDNECPKILLFDYEKELCFINDSLSGIKYPIWIAWIIRLVLSL